MRLTSLSKSIATLALAGIAGACVLTIDSVVRPGDAHFDARLLGTWRSDSEVAKVTRESDNTYAIAYTDDGKTGLFQARLGRLGARAVLDVWPVPNDSDIAEQYRGSLIPGHTILLVDIGADRVVTSGLKVDSLRAAIKRGQLRVDTLAYDRQLVLTNGGLHLRDALTTYVARRGVLDDPATWKRAK